MFSNDEISYLLAKYDRPVPRYTSYPAATQFHEHITAQNLVGTLSRRESVSIYIHIPFCHSLCHYCGCHTKIVHEQGPIDAYGKTLIEEIRLFSRNAEPGIKISRMHFGGGSPNYAKVELIEQILDTVEECFDVSKEMQIDMECDPRQLTHEKIARYASLGIGRYSLGIQDFDPKVQEAINRIQTFDHVQKCMNDFHAEGICDINFDLIVGLPRQTLETVSDTVDKAIVLSPSRMAVFPYAHVPWMKKHQVLLEKYGLPDARDRLEMIALVRNKLVSAGYESIGMDHFCKSSDGLAHAAKKGRLRRNFQGYTDDPSCTVLGFGLSAISQFENGYLQNTTNTIEYNKAIAEGRVPVQRGYILSEKDKKHRKIIEELLCRFHIPLEEIAGLDMNASQVKELQQDDLIRLADGVLEVTDKGKFFGRVIAACFDAYLQPKEVRHARAI